jgi:IS30 family transposase
LNEGRFIAALYIEGDCPLAFLQRGGILQMKRLCKYKIYGDIDTTVTGKLLYHILNEISGKKDEITISQRKISDALHISKGTVSRNLRRLRDGGYIEVYSTYNSEGGRSANKYIIK